MSFSKENTLCSLYLFIIYIYASRLVNPSIFVSCISISASLHPAKIHHMSQHINTNYSVVACACKYVFKQDICKQVIVYL